MGNYGYGYSLPRTDSGGRKSMYSGAGYPTPSAAKEAAIRLAEQMTEGLICLQCAEGEF